MQKHPRPFPNEATFWPPICEWREVRKLCAVLKVGESAILPMNMARVKVRKLLLYAEGEGCRTYGNLQFEFGWG